MKGKPRVLCTEENLLQWDGTSRTFQEFSLESLMKHEISEYVQSFEGGGGVVSFLISS